MGSALLVATPIVGAGMLWLLRNQAARIHWAVSVFLAALQTSLLLILGSSLPAEFVLSTWAPERLFQAQVHLTLSTESWAFSLSAAALLLSIFLAAPTRPGSTNQTTRMIGIAFVGLATAALLASNVVTVALTWAVADAFAYLALLREAENVETVTGLTRRFTVQAASALVIVAVAVPVRIGGALGPGELPLGSALLAAAVLLRVGLIPLHVGLPKLPGVRRGMGALVRLLPPAMGLVVLARELPATPSPGLRWVLLVFGGLSAVVGGARWFSSSAPVESRPFLVLCFAGMAVAAGSIGGQVGRSVVVGLGVAMILVGGVVSQWVSYEGWHRFLGWPTAAFSVSLPALLTLDARAVTDPAGELDLVGWGALAFVSAGLAFVVAGILRLGRSGLRDWASAEPLVQAAYGFALLSPLGAAVPIFLILGAAASTRALLIGAAGLGLGAGAALLEGDAGRGLPGRFGDKVAGQMEAFSGAVNRPGGELLRGGAAAIRAIGRIFEGRGAMLWIYVFVLMMALLVAPAGGG